MANQNKGVIRVELVHEGNYVHLGDVEVKDRVVDQIRYLLGEKPEKFKELLTKTIKLLYGRLDI